MDTLRLSNPPLMSRKREVTFRAVHYRVLIVSIRDRTAWNEERVGREPHWLR